MTPNPTVSIIIPSFNHGKWIKTAIESALNQTYENLEIIVVDDGSTDRSRDVIQSYASLPKVRAVLKESNRGQGHSCNLALDMARGKYVCFLPSDDWYLPEKTSLQVKLLEALPDKVGMIYGRGQRHFMDTGETVDVVLPMHRGNVLRLLVEQGNFVYPVTPMFRRSVFDHLRFDESYRAEGESIYIKVAEHYEIDYVDEVVAVMRGHTYNTGRAFEMMYADNVRWWTEYFSRPNVPAEVADLKAEVLGKIHRIYGLSILTELRKIELGRNALIQAISINKKNCLDFKILAAIGLTFMPRAISSPIFDMKRRNGKTA